MMRKVIPLVTFFVLLFAFAKWGPSISFSVATQSKGEPLVVDGSGTVFAAPEIAKLSVGIQQTGASLTAAKNAVDTASNTFTANLKSLGIDTKDIKTTSYTVTPQIDYQTQPQRITGYQVSIVYEITIADLDKVNSVLSQIGSSGTNLVGGITFELTENTKKQKLAEARKLAVVEAKEKATGLASAAGITLGKILNVSENQPGAMFKGVPAAERLDLSTPTTPDIQPGQTEITVTVSLSYEIR